MISTFWTTMLFMAMPMATFAQPEAVSKDLEMVVTANPLATLAGEKILQAGGTAVDAMVAIQNVLGLVEPQSSGLGGGAFLVYFDAKTKFDYDL
jgi:gamma-glutamyltranspeptidase/glutathione hydrolase